MKKKYGLLLASVILFFIQGSAQYRLLVGVPSSYNLVERPLVYHDIMRTQLPSWIREYKESNNDNWEKLNMVINKKDANGKLTTLNYYNYNADESKWDTVYINQYQYTLSNNNIVSERRDRWSDGQTFTYSTDSFLFQNNQLIKQFISYSANPSNSETIKFYTYDNNGKLLFDSSRVTTAQLQYSVNGNYYYNSYNQLIRYFDRIGSDTVRDYRFDYTLNKLAVYEVYSFNAIQGKFLLEKEEYTYDDLGRVKEAIMFFKTDNDPFPSLYKHGYTQDGKLSWTTRYEKNISNVWLMKDSIAINYKNGTADTSYGYISTNGTSWNNWPSFRYVFNSAFTGMNTIDQGLLQFNVYPNPTRETLNIQLNQRDNIKRITVTDLLGKTLLVSTTSGPISMEGIRPGTYFVTVETDNSTGTRKIIITE